MCLFGFVLKKITNADLFNCLSLLNYFIMKLRISNKNYEKLRNYANVYSIHCSKN